MLKVNPNWAPILQDLMESRTFKKLAKRLDNRIANGAKVLPASDDVLKAFEYFTPSNTKVVVLGQDPYAGLGQANGLAFSIKGENEQPPSLKNILLELRTDLGIERASGDLTGWAKQGVLLLNSTLTVEKGAPLSHHGLGWENVTDTIISRLSDTCEHIVFVLWGKNAQTKTQYIDETKHSIIKSTHPSPFSARRGFLGSKPFSLVNHYLEKHGQEPIDWSK